MYHVSRLKNGMTVASATMSHMASVSLGIWVGVGGRFEPENLNGVSHFIEHMLFKGTRRRSAREISQAVEGLGGYLNAFTGEESTCFYAKARHDHFPDLLDVLMDMFQHSRFEGREIEKERQVIKEEVAMYLDQPHQHVQELLNETLWPEHPLGRPVTGTIRSLDGLTRPRLLDFHRHHYVGADTLVTAAGAISHAQLLKTVQSYARHIRSGGRPGFARVEDQQTQPRVRLFTKNTAQMQLALGLRTCSRHDERRFALRLLNCLLGENMSSRLFQVVREDHGLAYSIHSSLCFFDDTGALIISAGLDTHQLYRSLKLIFKELRRFAQLLVSPRELRQTRDYLVGQLDLSLESTENQMMWLGEQLLGYGQVIAPAEIKRRIARVTPAEIRQAARTFFTPERVSMALVSSLKPGAVTRVKKAIEL